MNSGMKNSSGFGYGYENIRSNLTRCIPSSESMRQSLALLANENVDESSSSISRRSSSFLNVVALGNVGAGKSAVLNSLIGHPVLKYDLGLGSFMRNLSKLNVLASVIEPKLANTIIRRLNQISPLENLRHVKRIQKKSVEGGKVQLSVILCLAGDIENESISIAEGVQELINSYKLSPFITKVCQYAATSKEDWEEQCKQWPTSFHPPTYNIDGIGGFSEEDSHSVFDFMQLALKMARSGDGLIVNAAVIVDPSVNQVIASACDQTCSLYSSKAESCIGNCTEQPEVNGSHPDSSVVANHVNSSSKSSHDEPKERHISASCLNPWQWAQQKLHTTSSSWHPLHHASIVAIESSAARDRRLFPGLGHDVDKSCGVDSRQSSSTSTPTKRQKTDSTNSEYGDILNLPSVSARPYLCTGYDIYLVWEPCVMCAMALVHQRIRRIFYAFPNPQAGALGSVHRLQGEKSLNHHYAVFRVVLPKEHLDRDEIARTSE